MLLDFWFDLSLTNKVDPRYQCCISYLQDFTFERLLNVCTFKLALGKHVHQFSHTFEMCHNIFGNYS